jgi:hypothetical protein
LGDFKAETITLEERLAVAGPMPETMAVLQKIYAGGPCAFSNADVARHYEAGRLDAGATNLRAAFRQNGCGGNLN